MQRVLLYTVMWYMYSHEFLWWDNKVILNTSPIREVTTNLLENTNQERKRRRKKKKIDHQHLKTTDSVSRYQRALLLQISRVSTKEVDPTNASHTHW